MSHRACKCGFVLKFQMEPIEVRTDWQLNRTGYLGTTLAWYILRGGFQIRA